MKGAVMRKFFLAILILAAFAVLVPEAHARHRHHRILKHHRHHVVRHYGLHHGKHYYRPHYYRPYVHNYHRYPVYHRGGYGGVYVSGPRFSIGIGC